MIVPTMSSPIDYKCHGSGRRCGPGESHCTSPLSRLDLHASRACHPLTGQASTSTRIRYTAYTSTIYPAYTILHSRQRYTYIYSWALATSTRAGETPDESISGHPPALLHLATTSSAKEPLNRIDWTQSYV